MKLIPLTKGLYAKVDDEDFSSLCEYKWSACSNNRYAVRSTSIKHTNNKRPKTVRMHREIMKVIGNCKVDHINGNGLDNRKLNLRLANDRENQGNRRKCSKNTTGYKGVYKARNKFRATIRSYGKKISIGTFSDSISAAIAYDNMAIRVFGNFALTNKMMGLL